MTLLFNQTKWIDLNHKYLMAVIPKELGKQREEPSEDSEMKVPKIRKSR